MSLDTKSLKKDLTSLKKSSQDVMKTLVNHRFGVPRIQNAFSGGGGDGESNHNATYYGTTDPDADHTVLTSNEIELLDLYEEIEELNMAMMTMNEVTKMIDANNNNSTEEQAVVEVNDVDAEADEQAPRPAPAPITNKPNKKQVVRYTTDPSLINKQEEQVLIGELQDKINLLTHKNKLKSLAVEKYELEHCWCWRLFSFFLSY